MSANFAAKASAAAGTSSARRNIARRSTAAWASASGARRRTASSRVNVAVTTATLTSEVARSRPSAALPNSVTDTRRSPNVSRRASVNAASACSTGAGSSGASTVAFSLMFPPCAGTSGLRANSTSATPAVIATSATLKTPVWSGPALSIMKSTTWPAIRRSARFDSPPAQMRPSPTPASGCVRCRQARMPIASSERPMKTLSTSRRSHSGAPAPRLRNAPVFSAYRMRTEPPRYDRAGVPARWVDASIFVPRSHAIVETAASTSSAVRAARRHADAPR